MALGSTLFYRIPEEGGQVDIMHDISCDTYSRATGLLGLAVGSCFQNCYYSEGVPQTKKRDRHTDRV